MRHTKRLMLSFFKLEMSLLHLRKTFFVCSSITYRRTLMLMRYVLDTFYLYATLVPSTTCALFINSNFYCCFIGGERSATALSEQTTKEHRKSGCSYVSKQLIFSLTAVLKRTLTGLQLHNPTPIWRRCLPSLLETGNTQHHALSQHLQVQTIFRDVN